MAITRRSASWSREYYVITRGGDMNVFPSKRDFKANPMKPANTRPIALENYILSDESPFSLSTSAPSSSSSFSGDVTSNPIVQASASSAASPSLLLYLVPDGTQGAIFKSYRVWELRVDTEEEKGLWFLYLKQVCSNTMHVPASNSHNL